MEPAEFSVNRVYMCVCASNAYVFVFVLVQAYVFVPTYDGVQDPPMSSPCELVQLVRVLVLVQAYVFVELVQPTGQILG